MTYKIVEHADGTATVRATFSGRVIGTHPSADAANAWIEAQDLATETHERAKEKGLTTHCHYCGLPTVRGHCAECGYEI